MIRVYGASDDLIEIEGDITEEFYLDGTTEFMILSFSDGNVISFVYGPRGNWSAEPVFQFKNAFLTPVWEFWKDNPDAYSDVVTLHNDIDWIVAGTQIVRKWIPLIKGVAEEK